jgi:hypothetical protein
MFNGGSDLARPAFIDAEGEEKADEVFGRGEIDAEARRGGDDFDEGFAGREGEAEERLAVLPIGRFRSPEHVVQGAVEGGGSEVVGADAVEGVFGAPGFAADGEGNGEGDGGEGGREPEDGEECAAAGRKPGVAGLKPRAG